MHHLIVSREFPPAPYAAGGIGTYVNRIAGLLAERGETVHVIGQRWTRAPLHREELQDGRLVVHRIGTHDLPAFGRIRDIRNDKRVERELEGVRRADFANEWFSWHAALLIEHLIETEGIDVIEGQDWEAPLYYFLVRRAAGLGPTRRPPCIVHLHSPSEFVVHFNGLERTSSAVATLCRLEEYCIHAADALLSPSRYLAEQCQVRFHLDPRQVEVIPLPSGRRSQLDRSPEVWAGGSICFVGRLEPRKGMIEWIQAAGRVASDHSEVRFEFVGADVWRLRRRLVRRLPRRVRRRFRFHGEVPVAEVASYLKAARAAVVPSRWENFPNTCIEAMASGLPVIASPYGGMRELIEDGRAGWLAPDLGLDRLSAALEVALRRCLEAPPEELRRMGRAAAEAVSSLCDDRRITTAHLEHRRHLVAQGASRSSGLPMRPRPRVSVKSRGAGSAGAVIALEQANAARPVLADLTAQSRLPAQVIVVVRDPPDRAVRLEVERAGAMVLGTGWTSRAAAWNEGSAALAQSGPSGFCLFLDDHDRLAHDAIERIAGALEACPELAIVSFWTGRGAKDRRLRVAPLPKAAHQLVRNEVASASGYRSSALGQTPFRPDLPADLARWDLANRLLVEGWSAITLPCLLGDRIGEARAHDPPWWRARPLAADMMGRFAPLLSDEIQTFLTFHGAVLLPEPDERRSGVLRLLDLKNRFAWSLRNPGLGARGVAGRLRRLWPREV